MILNTLILAEILKFSQEDFDDAMRINKHLFVYFTAPWCAHCKDFEPHFEALARVSDVLVASINCENEQILCSKYEVTMYPDLKLFSQNVEKPETYLGAKDLNSMKDWITKITREFLIPIDKKEIKKDARKRGLKCYFILHGHQENFEVYKKKFEEAGVFMYFVQSDIEKLVAQREEYQFELKDLQQMMRVDQFIQQNRWPFLPEMTEQNYEQLSKRNQKQLLIIVNPTPEIQNVIEVNELNKVYKQLNNFNLVKADREFTIQKTKKLIGNKTTVVFFNGKNPKKLKLFTKEVENEEEFLLQALRFKPEKLGIIDLEEVSKLNDRKAMRDAKKAQKQVLNEQDLEKEVKSEEKTEEKPKEEEIPRENENETQKQVEEPIQVDLPKDEL